MGCVCQGIGTGVLQGSCWERQGWHGLASVQAAVESISDAGSPSVKMCFRAKMVERIVGGVKKKKVSWFSLVRLSSGTRGEEQHCEP